MTDQNIDDQERQCPRLGNPISFRFCLISGDDDMACFKIFDCWWERFDVEAYLKQNMPESAFNELVKVAEKPKSKIASIIEIAEKAKKTK